MKTALLIPIYQPEKAVPAFLSQFKKEDFDVFLIVDDGSGEDYKEIFDEISAMGIFDILSYPNNKGKGSALKAGIKHLTTTHPDLDAIVTCDSDGQHRYHDVLAVKDMGISQTDALVLGERDIRGKSIPLPSRIGKQYSSFYCRCLTGERIVDTQTGLRFIPKSLFKTALKTSGNRFEYETRFLLAAVKEAPLSLIPIDTVYEQDGPRKTHFRMIYDSVLCYLHRFIYVFLNLLFVAVEVSLYSIFSNLVFTEPGIPSIVLSSLPSLVVAGALKFILLQTIVFRDGHTGRRLLRYFFFWLVSSGIIIGASIGISYTGFPVWTFKLLFELVYGYLNYWLILSLVVKEKRK